MTKLRGCRPTGLKVHYYRFRVYNNNRSMITFKELNDIAENKIKNEAQKEIIRSSFPPHIANRMCAAIDGQETKETVMVSRETGQRRNC